MTQNYPSARQRFADFLNRSVPAPIGIGAAILGTGIGAVPAIVLALNGYEVPDSIFAASTYLGISGAAIVIRSVAKWSHVINREAFLARLIAGFVIVAFALIVDAHFDQPQWSPWVVYVSTVVVELVLLVAEAHRSPPPPATPSATVPAPSASAGP